MIPLVDLKAQYATIKPEVDSAIQAVVDSVAFINGPQVRTFEGAFAAFCGARHAVGVQSGTAALHLALMACDVGPGDEVIVPSMTFIATAEMIGRLGASPVFVDVDPRTCNLDPAALEKAVTPRTRAVIPVHLYGQPAEMDAILEIARRNGLRVIEDAAQAHGAEFRGRRVGTLGDVAVFSFYPGKNLGAYGDAGALVTNDGDLADQVRLLRNHGRRSKYTHEREGFNYRLDTLQAAVLEAKLPHLDAWNTARRHNAKLYRQYLSGLPVELPYEASHVRSVYHLFVIRVRRPNSGIGAPAVAGRDQVLEYLQANGVGAGVHYPIPLHMQPAYEHLGAQPDDLPASWTAAQEILSLPMYPELTEEQIRKVADTLREALDGAA
jgi:dTDP-4-amino-4,6-dideoxygalactose transaminase